MLLFDLQYSIKLPQPYIYFYVLFVFLINYNMFYNEINSNNCLRIIDLKWFWFQQFIHKITKSHR